MTPCPYQSNLAGPREAPIQYLIGLWILLCILGETLFALIPPQSPEAPVYKALTFFVLQILQSGIVVMVIPPLLMDRHLGRRPRSIPQHLRKHFVQVVIEMSRVIGWSMIGYVFLILPGLILQIWYYFVPYIVQFDPAYERGEVDALAQSKKLYKGRGWRLGFKVAAVSILFFGFSLLSHLIGNSVPLPEIALYITLGLGVVIQAVYEVISFRIYLGQIKGGKQ